MIEIIIPPILALVVTFYITPQFMKFLYNAGIVGLDLHKKNKPKLPTSGGICVAFGVLAGLLTYVGLQTFVYGLQSSAIYLLAVISTILIVTFVGLLDDLNVKQEKIETKEGLDIRFGLSQWIKPLLTLPAAIPLMIISAGQTSMAIPIIGVVNFGILYPLLLIPLGVVACSNLVNLLGGFNGSETGMGIIYLLSLGIYGLLNQSVGSVIFLISGAALLGFIRYNWYPARILPGDSLTYLLGAIVASGVIVGNMERAGIVIMLPFIIEFFLKLRSKFKATCLGILRKDGRLDAPYGKNIFSLTHIIMNIHRLYEKEVTMILIFIEFIFAVLIFLPTI